MFIFSLKSCVHLIALLIKNKHFTYKIDELVLAYASTRNDDNSREDGREIFSCHERFMIQAFMFLF